MNKIISNFFMLFILVLLPELLFAQIPDFDATKSSAEQGNASAQLNLGYMYANGRGVPENDVEAVKWYRLAAEQGLAIAQFNLGNMYRTGEGVPEDGVEAVKWLRLAAEQGVSDAGANAQFNLGYMYFNGQGIPKDDAEAVKWFRLAAEQGLAVAQESLGVMYVNGTGVPSNYLTSYFWLSIAMAQGVGAQTTLEAVKNLLTAEQLSQGQAAISKCDDLSFKFCSAEEARLVAVETARLEEARENARIVLSVSDVVLDFNILLGESVTVSGVVLKVGELGFIYEERGSMVFINFDDSSARRDVRQTILKNCGSGCRATVSGVVTNTVFGKTILVQSIE
jgi:hypothetical protein